MDRVLKRTVMTVAFAFAFIAVMFLCTDTVNATVDIQKDGSSVGIYNTFQGAVEAVNNDSSIKAGDDIKFIIDGETTAGNAPAFNKRINLEIVADSLDITQKFDFIAYGKDQTVNILNVGTVYIHDLNISCRTRIEDIDYDSDVKVDRVDFWAELKVKNVGTFEIDGTKPEGSHGIDGERSRVETLWITGTKDHRIKVTKVKNMVSDENTIDGDRSDGFKFTCADIDEVDNCRVNHDVMRLEQTRVRELKNTKVTFIDAYYESMMPADTGALDISNSHIDIIDNCTFIGKEAVIYDQYSNYRYYTNGIRVVSTSSAGIKPIGEMKNCAVYGKLAGIYQIHGGSDIGTIENCVITGGRFAIWQQTTIMGTEPRIDTIKGDVKDGKSLMVLYSADSNTIEGSGYAGFEPGLKNAVGTVRICSGNGSSLMNYKNKTLPSGYSWRKDNDFLAIGSKTPTPEDLKPYVNYDDKFFSYLSYDKCKVIYHEGAGTKKPYYDEFYKEEYHGGDVFWVKGFNPDYIGGVDQSEVFDPMQWTTDPEGKSEVVLGGEEVTSVTITEQKNYDYYAKYKPETYFVAFDTGEHGSDVELQQVFKENAPKEPVAPTHPGASFDGWYLDENYQWSYQFGYSISDKVDENNTVTLYAKWNLNDCKVTFDAKSNGGKVDTQKTVKWNETVEPPEDPEYTDPDLKHFDGWYTTKEKGGARFDFDTPIKNDTKLYARFDYNKSTITIDMDGGTVAVNKPWKKDDQGNIVYKGEVTDRVENLPWSKLNTPRKGSMYTYEGLYEDPEFNTPTHDFDGDDYLVPKVAEKTYYAKFTPKNYTVRYYGVTYDEYEKNSAVAPIKTESLPYGSEITYEPEEYADSFAGWDPYYMYGTSTNPVRNWDGTVIDYEMRLFMKENPKLIFHGDIAGTKVLDRAYVKEGENLESFAGKKAEQVDYNFVGWTTKPKTDGEYNYKETLPDEGKPEQDAEDYPYVGFFDFNRTMPEEDIHLYPVFVRDRLRVILNVNGGVLGEGDDGKPQSDEFTVDINEKLRMQGMNTATNEGYDLDGWYTQTGVKWNENWGVTPEYCAKDEDGTPIRIEEKDKNYYYYTVKLTAIWQPKEIDVEYNGGEHGTTDAQGGKATVGSTISLAAAATPDDGYVFIGWADSKEGLHSAGEEFLFDDSKLDLLNDGKLVFTAQYEVKPPESHTITFDTVGGTYIAPITQEVGSLINPPEEPTREGYRFLNWDPGIPSKMPNYDMTCEAQWEKVSRQYTISFDSMGGSEVKSIKAYEGTAITQPEDPVKDHYAFTGWTPTFPKVMPSANTTFTATWKPATYKVTFDANGGKFGDGKATLTVSDIYDAPLAVPEDPTRDNYEFTGWEGEIPAHIPDSDITIKATWNKIGPDEPTPVPDPDPITPSDDSINKAKADNKLAISAKSVSTVGSMKKKTMTIKWNKVKNATNYRLAYRHVGKNWSYVWTGGKNTYTLKKLKKNGLYEFKLQAVRKNGSTWTKSNFGKVNYRMFASTTQKVKATKKGFVVNVKKVSKASGYEVIYSVKKNMKSKKTKTFKGVKKTKLKVGKLKAKKTYYVRSIPYKIYKGHKYIGVLNKVKKVKTKK